MATLEQMLQWDVPQALSVSSSSTSRSSHRELPVLGRCKAL